MVFSDERVGFAIAETRFCGNYLRRRVNHSTVRDFAAARILARSFAPLLLTAQVQIKLSARLFVSVNILINPLGTDYSQVVQL